MMNAHLQEVMFPAIARIIAGSEKEHLSVKAIAEALHWTYAKIYYYLTLMESKGHIVRYKPSDSRAEVWKLTYEGRYVYKLIPEIQPIVIQPVEKIIIETPVVTAPVVEEQTMSVQEFDLNKHFNTFIKQTTQLVMQQVEQRLQKEMETFGLKLSDDMSKLVNDAADKMSKAVIQKSMDIINKSASQQRNESIAQHTHEHQVFVTRNGLDYTSMLASNPTLQTTQPVVGEAPHLRPAQITKPKLMKICITNLKPNQCGTLVQEFGETFDLMFWNGNMGNNVDQLREYCKSCDITLWHAKHSSHSSFGVAQSTTKAAAKRLISVGGDLSRMRNVLMELYAGAEKL